MCYYVATEPFWTVLEPTNPKIDIVLEPFWTVLNRSVIYGKKRNHGTVLNRSVELSHVPPEPFWTVRRGTSF